VSVNATPSRPGIISIKALRDNLAIFCQITMIIIQC